MDENLHLTDEQIETIAERAAEKVIERIQLHVGKTVISKFLWLLGAVGAAAAAWMNGYITFK
jgi:hypothetical protein